MSSCLQVQRSHISAQVDAMLDGVLAIVLAMGAKEKAAPSKLKAAEAAVRKQFAEARPKLIRSAHATIDRMLSASDALAEQLFKRLDENGDGRISKNEFETNIGKAFNEVSAVSLGGCVSVRPLSVTDRRRSCVRACVQVTSSKVMEHLKQSLTIAFM
jgi:hypothetical protein